jgi:hypothetical protein
VLKTYSLLFCGTTFLSIYTVKFFEWNNRLPGYESRDQANAQNIDPDKAAFSMAPHDEEAYTHVPMNDHDDHHDSYGAGPADPYTGLGGGSAYDDHASTGYAGVGRQPSHGSGSAYDDHASTSYVGAGRQPSHGSGYSGSGAPENPFRQDDPFDDDHQYNAHQSSTSVNRPYAPPSAHEDFDDDRPVQFPAGNYERHL